MSIDSPNVRSIFDRAVELSSDAARNAFLDEACGSKSEVRAQVEDLLRAHAAAGEFLERPAIGPNSHAGDGSPVAGPGTIVGSYKLLQQIGEGGMGVVFLAEQLEPIRRMVALKIVKPGMDTRHVIARFESERQALAVMDHQNIAKVLDAGATSSGRPYFVMELVKGIPITRYCDEQQLPLRERLLLFTHICQAVQHAHQKGIIHRDLKPTNVLVAECDGKPVPKVIDFGVAKATGQAPTEGTLFTEFGQVVGTVEYMSPEQAKLNHLDVDTRSDVYSLGVMLYELLTGSTPFERRRLQEAAFDEMLRIIREEEPPKPSTRLSTSDALPSIAANRGLEPVRLNRTVQGELDWIVMKSLEKDRNQRYETADGLAADIHRFLNDEAVQARPTTRAYRLRKFARRNKAGVWALSAIVASLVAGMALASVGIVEARREARIAHNEAARATQAQQFLQAMLASVNPDTEHGAAVTVQQVLDRAAREIETVFAEQPETRAVMHETIGRSYYGMLMYQAATDHLNQAVTLRRRYVPGDLAGLADAEYRLAQAYSWEPNQLDLALAHCRAALNLYETLARDDDSRVVAARALEGQLAGQTAGQIDSDIWGARALPIALALTSDKIARLPNEWAQAVSAAQELSRAGDVTGAQRALAEGHRAVLTTIRNLCSAGQHREACQYLRRVYAPCLRMPLVRPLMPVSLISEAWELKREGMNLSVIEVILREAVFAGHDVWGPEHPYIARALSDLANVLRELGKFSEAEALARQSLEMRRKLLGMENPDTIVSVLCLIEVLDQEGKQSEARNLRREFRLPDEGRAKDEVSK
ncbi:MAG: protein kinase [Pirellulales bacterium]